jgi:hypothetical protein
VSRRRARGRSGSSATHHVRKSDGAIAMRHRFFWSVSAAGLLVRIGVLVCALILVRLYDWPM